MIRNTDLKIFVSYRRADSPCFAERVRDWFSLAYKRENVFMDFDAIPPFVRFESFILEQIRLTDVMLVIIGPRWLSILQKRLGGDDPDYVRIEIATALRLGKLIAPILVDGATMPDDDLLPADIRPMTRFNAARLHGGRQFLDTIEILIDALPAAIAQNARLLGAAPLPAAPPAAPKVAEAPAWLDDMAPPPPAPAPARKRQQESDDGHRPWFLRGLRRDDADDEQAAAEAEQAAPALESGATPPPPPQEANAQPAPAGASPLQSGEFNALDLPELEDLVHDDPEDVTQQLTPPRPMVLVASEGDRVIASSLRDRLQQSNNVVRLIVPPGVDDAARARAIEDASVVLPLLSPVSRRDLAMQAQIAAAQDSSAPVLPVLIDGDMQTAVPYSIAAHQMVDLRDDLTNIDRLLQHTQMYTM